MNVFYLKRRISILLTLMGGLLLLGSCALALMIFADKTRTLIPQDAHSPKWAFYGLITYGWVAGAGTLACLCFKEAWHRLQNMSVSEKNDHKAKTHSAMEGLDQ